MSKKEIYKLLSLSMSLGVTNSSYGDPFLLGNERLMSYSISLMMEIDELLEKGHSKEEIAELIVTSKFRDSDPTLSGEEESYLKTYSLGILDIREELYLHRNDEDKPKEAVKGFPKNNPYEKKS